MRILALSAHPDDAEISCGGTMAKHYDDEILSVYFCPCTEDPRNKGHVEDHKAVTNHLGVDSAGYEFPRDILENHIQQVRDQLWTLKEEFDPHLVLAPSVNDFHQDHKTLGSVVGTIFRRKCSILAYEVLTSVTPQFSPNHYIILSEEDVERKMDAVGLYKTQINNRAYSFKLPSMMGLMQARGIQVGATYAEAYEYLWGTN